MYQYYTLQDAAVDGVRAYQSTVRSKRQPTGIIHGTTAHGETDFLILISHHWCSYTKVIRLTILFGARKMHVAEVVPAFSGTIRDTIFTRRLRVASSVASAAINPLSLL